MIFFFNSRWYISREEKLLPFQSPPLPAPHQFLTLGVGRPTDLLQEIQERRGRGKVGGQEGRRWGLGKKGVETNGQRRQRPQAWKSVAVLYPHQAVGPEAQPRARRALEPARGRSRSRPPEGAAGAGTAEPKEGGGEPAEKGQPRRQGRQRRSSAPRASPVPAPQ